MILLGFLFFPLSFPDPVQLYLIPMYSIFFHFLSSWFSKEYWVISITGYDILLTAAVLFDPPHIRSVEPKFCNLSVVLFCNAFSILDIHPFSTAAVLFHAPIMLAAALLFVPPIIRLVQPFSTATVSFYAIIIRFVEPWFCDWWSVSDILSFCKGFSVSDILSFLTAAVLSNSQLFNPFIHYPLPYWHSLFNPFLHVAVYDTRAPTY